MAVDINGNEIKIGDRVKRVVDVDLGSDNDRKCWGYVGQIYTVKGFDIANSIILEELGGCGASSKKFEIVEDNKKTIEEKLAIIRAHLEGAEIEYSSNGKNHWVETNTPVWNWETNDYRVKPVEIKEDYIDWSHVSDEFKFMVRNNHGTAFLHTTEPRKTINGWSSMSSARVHSPSYKAGNKPWNESLVKRPEKEG